MANTSASGASEAGTEDSATPDAPAEAPKKRAAPRGEAAWQAARQEVADRNAKARKLGKAQRKEHEDRIAVYRRAY